MHSSSKLNLLWILCLILSFTACKDEEDPDPEKDHIPTEELIQIDTDFGKITLWLYKGTPLHRANMIKLAKEKYYDSTTFHRIVKSFVIQGGDPNSKNNDPDDDGDGGPPYTVEAEIDSANFKHIYGALGAARDGDADNPERRSNGSQFYIVVDYNGEPGLDGNYTVFGRVINGMETAKEIERQRISNSRPITPIPMSVSVVNYTLQQLKDSFDFVP